MTASRRGAITGATWLIGLGIVFLVREAMGWTWGEAWPLFVILVGVATLHQHPRDLASRGSPGSGRSPGRWPGSSSGSCCS